MSDEQLIAHVNILLVAGHETSTSLSAWLLYLLNQHPDYAERVLDEQATILGTKADPDLEDIKHLKVLNPALSEAERLYPTSCQRATRRSRRLCLQRLSRSAGNARHSILSWPPICYQTFLQIQRRLIRIRSAPPA